jgi:hypothetical protein
MEVINIGPVPCNEKCAQTGIHGNYAELQIIECKAYIHALKTVYGEPPETSSFFTKTYGHDFGSYREVIFKYHADEPDAVAYADKVENGLETWAEARMTAPVKYDGAKVLAVLETPEEWMWPTLNESAETTAAKP